VWLVHITSDGATPSESLQEVIMAAIVKAQCHHTRQTGGNNMGEHEYCDKFKRGKIIGFIGESGDCSGDGHYLCMECIHQERVQSSTGECGGCYRPVEMCVCPAWFQILSIGDGKATLHSFK